MARRVLGAIAAAAAAGFALVAMATPSGAHTPSYDAKCVDEKAVLTVDLKAYQTKKDNTLVVTDGVTPLDTITFKAGHSQKWELPGDVEHTFTIVVTAWDDPDGTKGWSFKKELKVEKCVTPPSNEVPPVETTPSEAPSSSVTPPSSTTDAPPAPAGAEEPPLAATGASTTWSLLIGLGLVGAGAAAVLAVRRKRA